MPAKPLSRVAALARGFSLIEIVLTLVILGLLAAVALPRFSNLDNQAHRASVSGAASGFRSAVTMVRMARRVNGFVGPGANDNVRAFGANDIDLNATGFPVETNNANAIASAQSCIRVWNGILFPAPTVNTTAGSDFLATSAGQVCTFTYNRQAVPVRRITYNANTGAITLINP